MDVRLLYRAFVPYFTCDNTMVQVSARNAAQYLIPHLDEIQKHQFILTSKNVCDIVNIAGKDIPIISVLKLFLAYAQLGANAKLFCEDLFYYLLHILSKTYSSEDEKITAFLVLKKISLYYEVKKDENNIVVSNSVPSTGKEEEKHELMVSKGEADMLEALNMPHIFKQLKEEVNIFAAACLHSAIANEGVKKSYDSFNALLKSLNMECMISSHGPLLYDILLSQNVNITLIEIILGLLDGKSAKNFFTLFTLIKFVVLAGLDNHQHQNWSKDMLCQSWKVLLILEQECETFFQHQQFLCLSDKLWSVLKSILKKHLNEVSHTCALVKMFSN